MSDAPRDPSVPPTPPLPPVPPASPSAGQGVFGQNATFTTGSGYSPPTTGGYSQPAQAAPGYAAPVSAPPYASGPQGGYPSGGFTGYGQANYGQGMPYGAVPVGPPRGEAWGLTALTLALVSAVIVPIVCGILGYQIGLVVDIPIFEANEGLDVLPALVEARGLVLVTEIIGWIGFAAGIAAIVLGIMAIVKRSARGAGIASLITSVLGFGVFWAAFAIGMAAGMLAQ